MDGGILVISSPDGPMAQLLGCNDAVWCTEGTLIITNTIFFWGGGEFPYHNDSML